jgi:hypothetical protein
MRLGRASLLPSIERHFAHAFYLHRQRRLSRLVAADFAY